MPGIDLTPVGETPPTDWTRTFQVHLVFQKLTLGVVLYVGALLVFIFKIWAGPSHWIGYVPMFVLLVSVPKYIGHFQLNMLESMGIINRERKNYLMTSLTVSSILGAGFAGLLAIRSEAGREFAKFGINPGPLGVSTDVFEKLIEESKAKELPDGHK